MAKRKQKGFHPGEKKVGGKPRTFTREELKSYADGTNSAILAGIPIPLLKKHATPGADDQATSKFSATDGAGWLEGVQFDPADGSLTWEMDVPPEIDKGIEDGTIKFTSPEFRPNYEPNNPAIKFKGPLIRHVAFTPAPRDPVQGPIEAIAMSEEAIQCSDEDYQPQEKDAAKDPSGADKKDNPNADEPPAKNPDIPADTNAKTKMAAIVACFSQLGAELPSDFSFDSDGAIDILLAVLKTLAKAKAEGEAAEQEPDKPEIKEDQPVSFSEAELAALPANVQAALKKTAELEAQVVQFSEERTAAAKEKSLTKVRSLKLPKGIKDAQLAILEAVQFSEADDSAWQARVDTICALAAALPPAMVFDESAVAEPTHEQGEEFFRDPSAPPSDEEIQARVDEQLRMTGHKGLGKSFKWENPNPPSGGPMHRGAPTKSTQRATAKSK